MLEGGATMSEAMVIGMDAMYRGLLNGMVLGLFSLLLLWGACEVAERITAKGTPSEIDLRKIT
jgi:hypothetical protein